MNKVTVFNLNVHPLKEIFKGEEVYIEAQDYWRDKSGKPKELDIYEANDYRGQYAPVPFDGSGKMLNDPRYYKMLRIDPVGEHASTADVSIQHKCMFKGCKHVAMSSEALDTHAKESHPSVERLVLPEQDTLLEKKKEKKVS